MSMIFTDPPYAQVGATEQDLESAGFACEVARARFPETGRAITMSTRFGLWKLIVDPVSREILGTTVLGPRADDLAHLVAVMMVHRGTVEQILEQPWYHPTLSEVMLTLARELGVGQGPVA
jgi:pyruvate/2-oxoglutarate dehydrogenase complex dihydrolipoamide dehydrogenase (E3) component